MLRERSPSPPTARSKRRTPSPRLALSTRYSPDDMNSSPNFEEKKKFLTIFNLTHISAEKRKGELRPQGGWGSLRKQAGPWAPGVEAAPRLSRTHPPGSSPPRLFPREMESGPFRALFLVSSCETEGGWCSVQSALDSHPLLPPARSPSASRPGVGVRAPSCIRVLSPRGLWVSTWRAAHVAAVSCSDGRRCGWCAAMGQGWADTHCAWTARPFGSVWPPGADWAGI